MIFQSWLKYFFTAKRGGHGVHSPLVYKWVEWYTKEKKNIFLPTWTPANPEAKIIASEFGAGSKVQQPRTASNYLKRIAWNPPQLKFLYSFLSKSGENWRVLELGTGGGSCTLMLDAHGKVDKVVSVDADTRFTSELGQHLSSKTKLENQLFSDYLAATTQQFDLVILDGDHLGERVEDYVSQIVEGGMLEEGWIVLDDIRWSADMLKAWEKLRDSQAVSISVDAGRTGYLYFGKRHTKETFRVYIA